MNADEHGWNSPQMDTDIHRWTPIKRSLSFFDEDDEHDDKTRLNSVSCGFGGGNFFEKTMEVEGL
jgi:hypothetical protein